VAEFTTGGDLVVIPDLLKIQPRLSEAMERASFDQGFSPGAGCATEPFRESPPRFPSTCSCRRLWQVLGGGPLVSVITVIAPACE
jgi:hypothetical protein